jgi:hypothetical protein
MTTRPLVFVALALSACEVENPFEFGYCPRRENAIDVRIANVGGDEPVTDDLVVYGTARHASGMALLDVYVAGQAATSTSGNFSAWQVTIPYDVLVAVADPDGLARLEVAATDICGDAFYGACALDAASTEECLVVQVDTAVSG